MKAETDRSSICSATQRRIGLFSYIATQVMSRGEPEDRNLRDLMACETLNAARKLEKTIEAL